MVFVYHGHVPELAKQVEETQWRINQRYLEIFGNEGYEKLEQAVNRILTPESYVESIDDLKKITGEDFPETTPSKFLFACLMDLKIDKDGRIGNKNARLGCGFYITENSFNHSGSSHISDQIVASYIHEFDHFVPMVLQKTPLYLAHAYLTNNIGTAYKLEDLTETIVKIGEDDALSPDEKQLKVSLASTAYALFDVWEDSTRILDKLVLEGIGIDAPLPFRGKKREYLYGTFKPLDMIVAIPNGGDPFFGMSDLEAVRRVVNWETYFRPAMNISYVNNLYETLKNLRPEYIPFGQVLKESQDPNHVKKERRKERKRMQKVAEEKLREIRKKKGGGK